MSDSIAIHVENLHKSFRDGRDQILRGIDLKFQNEKLTYILGPSGTGKSVTIKHILGLLSPDRGKVMVKGQDVASLDRKQLREYRTQFGMLFQNSALFDDFSVYENVAFPLYEHTQLSEEEVSEKVSKTLTLLGMKTGYDKFPNELSGGMRKRVGLARAIVREPSILLYDEPTTGLDPVTRATVDELILTIKRELKVTSIVISHDIPSALSLADEIVFLFEGKVAFCGTAQEFKDATHPKIQEFLIAERKASKHLQ